MQAIVTTRYGAPDVLALRDVPVPEPKAREVRVCVHAAVVSSADTSFRKGDPLIVRLMYGWSRPRLAIPGVEFSGVVDAVGAKVTTLAVGDEVYGMSPDHFGAHAERVCVAEKGPITRKPRNLTHAEAVALCEGASTALTFLQKTANVQPGQRVLVNGAAGAVGSYGVQVARHLGAHVTAVCSARNTDFVRSVGANEVVDHESSDFTQLGQQWDVVFDAVGKRSFRECRGCLRERGLYLTTIPSWAIIGAALRTLFGGGKRARFVTAGLMQSAATLAALRDLAESGALRATVEQRFALAEVPAAHALVDTGHKRSSAVVVIRPDDTSVAMSGAPA